MKRGILSYTFFCNNLFLPFPFPRFHLSWVQSGVRRQNSGSKHWRLRLPYPTLPFPCFIRLKLGIKALREQWGRSHSTIGDLGWSQIDLERTGAIFQL